MGFGKYIGGKIIWKLSSFIMGLKIKKLRFSNFLNWSLSSFLPDKIKFKPNKNKMDDSSELVLEDIIKLIRSSELKFKKGNFKGAIYDKRKANSILKSKSNDETIIEKFKEELSKLYLSKFDLIFDHKLKIDESKKNEIIKLLEKKSEEKFNKGDYKGAVKALRRSEKYFSK